MSDKAQIPLKVPAEYKEQLKVIASEEGRSLNAEITQLIKVRIQNYRKENPEVQLDLLTK